MTPINFPNKAEEQKTLQSEIAQQNEMYLEGIRARMNAEYDALVRANDPQAIVLGTLIKAIVNNIVDQTSALFTKNSELNNQVQAPYFVNQCIQSVNAIFAGGVISPLTGDDAEWHDITVPEDIGKEFKVEYRDNEYAITIESVQVNLRYPKIYRLNNDNRFAHRIDYFQFHNVANPANVSLTQDSIRFIQFPYTMQSLHSQCIVENGAVVDYLDFDHNEVANGLVYPDQSSNDPHSYVIAPKIPFHMLEEAGISVNAEVMEFDEAVDSQECPYQFDDEDGSNDEWEDSTEPLT